MDFKVGHNAVVMAKRKSRKGDRILDIFMVGLKRASSFGEHLGGRAAVQKKTASHFWIFAELPVIADGVLHMAATRSV